MTRFNDTLSSSNPHPMCHKTTWFRFGSMVLSHPTNEPIREHSAKIAYLLIVRLGDLNKQDLTQIKKVFCCICFFVQNVASSLFTLKASQASTM